MKLGMDIISKEIINSDSIVFKEANLDYDSNCSTGDNDYLLPKLKASLKRAKAIDIIVGFLMESGVKLLILVVINYLQGAFLIKRQVM